MLTCSKQAMNDLQTLVETTGNNRQRESATSVESKVSKGNQI